ncbi:MAG: tetratricopeptide repeat protein [Bacteroidales bacterium]|jgi:tetratricopeptide (TPR) repeat protein|nr:tetratricopeptide repeat protein [Bacteroidales bacterium]
MKILKDLSAKYNNIFAVAKHFLESILIIMILFACKSSQHNTEIVQYSKEQLNIYDLLLQAETAYETGNTAEALKIYKNVLTLDTKLANAYNRISLIYFEQQNYEQAIEYAKKSIELSNKNIWYRIQLAKMYYVLGSFPKSAEIYEQILKIYPDKLDMYQSLVEVYQAAQDYDNMIRTLDRIETKWGVTEEVCLTKFSLYNMQGKHENAEKEVEKLAKQYPNDSKYNSMLAEMAMQVKNYNKAFSYYKQVEKSNPDDAFVQIALANYYLQQKNKTLCYEYLMRACKNTGLDANTKLQVLVSVYGDGVDENREDFERFFSLLQEISYVNNDNAQVWSLLSTGYLRKNDFENAAISIKKSLELGNKNYDLYEHLLFAQSALSNNEANFDSVINVANKTIELYPEQPLPYLFKGVNLMLKQEYSEAIITLHKGEKLIYNNNPVKIDFYANLGETYYKVGNYDSSDYYFEKTFELDSSQYTSMNNYAYYLSLRNTKLDRAEELAKKVVNLFPENHIYVDTYAWILYQKGRFAEAKSLMDNVLHTKDKWSATETEHYKAIINALEKK